jgi:hypothetical protein
VVLNTIDPRRISLPRNSETCWVRDFEQIRAIRRNRLASNWVASLHAPTHSPKPQARRRSPRILFISLSGLLIAAFVTLWPVASDNKPKAGSSLPGRSKHSMDFSDHNLGVSCSPDGLWRQLLDVDPTSTDGLETSGLVTLSEAQNLGGELVYRAICREAKSAVVFQVTWSKSSTGWQLKKISRQPEGVPGD